MAKVCFLGFVKVFFECGLVFDMRVLTVNGYICGWDEFGEKGNQRVNGFEEEYFLTTIGILFNQSGRLCCQKQSALLSSPPTILLHDRTPRNHPGNSFLLMTLIWMCYLSGCPSVVALLVVVLWGVSSWTAVTGSSAFAVSVLQVEVGELLVQLTLMLLWLWALPVSASIWMLGENAHFNLTLVHDVTSGVMSQATVGRFFFLVDDESEASWLPENLDLVESSESLKVDSERINWMNSLGNSA